MWRLRLRSLPGPRCQKASHSSKPSETTSCTATRDPTIQYLLQIRLDRTQIAPPLVGRMSTGNGTWRRREKTEAVIYIILNLV